MSTFDADLFLNTQVDGEFSTAPVPIPDGEYPAQIESVAGRAAKDSKVMDVTWQIQPIGIDGADNRKVRQSIFLDVTESGGLDVAKGKNWQLGRLLEALGLNGKPWSPSTLVGRVAKIKTSFRMGDGEHKGKIFHDVKDVVKL